MAEWKAAAVRHAALIGLALLTLPGVGRAQNDVKRLTEQVEALQAQQTRLQEQISALTKQLSDLKEQQGKKDAITKKASAPVAGGYGQIKFAGLAQNWVVGAIAGGGNSTARIRRMELKFAGEVRPDVKWTIMVDPAKTLSVNTTTLNGTSVVTGVNQNSAILQDAFISYAVTPQLCLNVGQEKVPLSMCALRSSTQIPTVERPIMNALPAGNGRIGDIRDLGVQAKWTSPKADVTLALLNDTGPGQNNTDNNNRKDVMYRLVYKGLSDTQMGISGTLFADSYGASKTPRRRFGAEFALRRGPHTFEAEYGYAKDAPGGVATRAEGGYAMYAHQVSPKLQLVARSEVWNPNLDAANARERDFTLGINWFLQGHNAKIQLNWVRKDIAAGAPSFLGTSRTLLLTNFQTAW